MEGRIKTAIALADAQSDKYIGCPKKFFYDDIFDILDF